MCTTWSITRTSLEPSLKRHTCECFLAGLSPVGVKPKQGTWVHPPVGPPSTWRATWVQCSASCSASQEWWSNAQLLGLTKSIWVVSSNWWGRSPILCRSPLRTFLEPTIFGWTLYFTVVATGERWRASEGLLLATISSPQWRKRLFPYAFKLGNRFWLLYAYILNSSSEYPLFLKSLGQMLESTPTGPFFLLMGEFNAHMSDDSVTWRGMNGRKWSEPILH